MKKHISFLLMIILCLLLTGCGADKQEYVFRSQGVKVYLKADASYKVSTEDKEPLSYIAVSDAATGEYKGSISVDLRENGVDLETLFNEYKSGNGEYKKTRFSNNLLFVDMVGSYPNGGSNDWYIFIKLDEKTHTVLFGRFSASLNDRNAVLSLAKSLAVEKTEKVSPYPDDYTQIKPTIRILSSGEEVTEYCVVPGTWKGEAFDPLDYEEYLKDKKVYLLSAASYDTGHIIFENGEHRATTHTASVNGDTLFNGGAKGYRIYRPSELEGQEFYVKIFAQYGSSGELTFVFKCKFE